MKPWARWLLFAFEVLLGVAYLAAFVVFVSQSRDFVMRRENERARAAALALDPSTPRTFSFRPFSADTALLGIGWWLDPRSSESRKPLSADGQWSGSHADAFLPVSAGAENLTLEIDGEAFVAPGHDVSIVLSLDGAEVSRWTARNGDAQPPVIVSLPATVTADGIVEVRWDVFKPAVPEHYGYTDRTQSVGFLLRSMTLETN